MDLAVIYNVWDGEELLEASIEQLRPVAKHVIALWQTQSYHGEAYSPWATIEKLLHARLIDQAVRFEPDSRLPGQVNELTKRGRGLQQARAAGASHFLLLDCDELYMPAQVKWAIEQIEAQDIDASACQMRTFYRRPDYQIVPPEEYFVPFIHRLSPQTSLGGPYPVAVDPTRAVQPIARFRAFARNELEMFHYSWVRNDIARKMRGMSVRPFPDHLLEPAAQLFRNYQLGQDPLIYQGHRVVQVKDEFGLLPRLSYS